MDAKALRQELFLLSGKLHSMNIGIFFTDVSRREFFTLEIIYRYVENNQNPEGIYVSELAKCQKTSSPAVSRTLRGMEEKGWIGRRNNPADRRNTYIYLTEEGKKIRKETADIMDRLSERIIERMGYDKMRQLLDLTSDLENVMRQEIDIRKKSIKQHVEDTEGRNNSSC